MKTFLAKLKHEVVALIPQTLFFFVAIGLLMLTKRLMLQQYGIPFSDFAAVVIGALIVGKVVLIADALPFINRYPDNSPPVERQGRERGIDREGSNDRSDRDCGRRLRPCRRFADSLREGATEWRVLVR